MSNPFYTPERPLEPPEPVVVYYCDWCGEAIYAGDTAYRFEGLLHVSTICERCIEDCRFIAERPEEEDEDAD